MLRGDENHHREMIPPRFVWPELGFWLWFTRPSGPLSPILPFQTPSWHPGTTFTCVP